MAIVGVFEGGYDDAHRERIRAHEKHKAKPGGSMEMKPADDPDWFPVLCEEVGEVAREINDYLLYLVRLLTRGVSGRCCQLA